jgi:hypothetical protein
MKAPILVLATALAACQASLASTGVSSTHVETVSAGQGDFAGYHSFGFVLAEAPPVPYQVSSGSFDVERRVRRIVASELVKKGYLETSAHADFVVRLSSGSAKVVGGEGDPGSNGRTPTPVTVGSIVVDAFDTSTEQQVWHSTAERELRADAVSDSALQAAVGQMLASFPARDRAPSAGAASLQSAQ